MVEPKATCSTAHQVVYVCIFMYATRRPFQMQNQSGFSLSLNDITVCHQNYDCDLILFDKNDDNDNSNKKSKQNTFFGLFFNYTAGG